MIPIKKINQATLQLINRMLEKAPLSANLKLRSGLPLSLDEKRGMVGQLVRSNSYPKQSEKLLIWRGPSGRTSIYVEIMIALALQLRGVESLFVICDAAFSGCIQRSIEEDQKSSWQHQCTQCIGYGLDTLKAVGLPYVKISKLVSGEKRMGLREFSTTIPLAELERYEVDNIPLGMFAKASTLRYLRGRTLIGQDELLRRYFYSGLICSEAVTVCIKDWKPSHFLMQQHDFYVDWAPAFRRAASARIPAVFWGGGMYEDGDIALRSVTETHFASLHSVSEKTWEQNSRISLNNGQNSKLDLYLSDLYKERTIQRVRGRFNSETQESRFQIFPDNKPVWCIFAHVTWGEAANFDSTIYSDTVEWLLDTIKIIKDVKDITWVIKAHPAELRGTVQGIEEVLRKAYQDIDWNKHLIPASAGYTLPELITYLSGGITLSGTPGLELALNGLPVILAGDAHYSKKGFTQDAISHAEYRNLLVNAALLEPLTLDQLELARRYAYLTFFKRRLSLKVARGRYRYAPIDFRKLELLLPGNDEVLDLICERIIDGGEFILDV